MRFFFFILLLAFFTGNAQTKLVKKSVEPMGGISLPIYRNPLVPINGAKKKLFRNPASLYSYYLPQSAKVSMGVFKVDGSERILVKTLSNAQTLTSGAKSVFNVWDGKNDSGVVLSSSDQYEIGVVAHNFTYNWGLVGNTSYTTSGSQWHGYDNIYSMCFAGTKGFAALGYAEAANSKTVFSTTNPQVHTAEIYPVIPGQGAETHFAATDGTNVYWAEADPNNLTKWWVHATAVSNNAAVTFSSGTSYTPVHGVTLPSTFDMSSAPTTGLAVGSNFVFTSHASINEIHVFAKSTAATAQTIAITNPRSICTDGNDNLWVAGANTVTKYTINGDGTLTSSFTISGFQDPLAIAVNPANSLVYVADGGNSQRIKTFDVFTGTSGSMLGQVGGYSSTSTVANDRFAFVRIGDGGVKTPTAYIAFQSDGSFWVGDYGNMRNMHFSSTNVYIDQIAYTDKTYSISIDANNPARVFNKWLEYEIDYTKDITDPLFWKLKRNWSAINSNYLMDIYGEFRTVNTMSNGRTYALCSVGGTGFSGEVIELVNNGIARPTGFVTGRDWIIGKDGSLYQQGIEANTGTPTTWHKRDFLSFDVSGNPSWSNTAVTTYTAPSWSDNGPLFRGNYNTYKPNEVTDNGVVVTYNPRPTINNGAYVGGGSHLAGIKNGKYLFNVLPATHRGYSGLFPLNYFDIGNNVNSNAGSVALAAGPTILASYHGEFWKNAQVNMFWHYADNGLFLGQFGNSTSFFGFGAPGMAGNSFCQYVTKVGNAYYLFHNDESYGGGVHVWKIDNASSFLKFNIPIPYPGSYTPPVPDRVNLMAGLPFATILSGTTVAGWTKVTNNGTFTASTSYQSYEADYGRDIVFSSNQPGDNTTNYGEKSLGNNIGLNAWSISGQIYFGGAIDLASNQVSGLQVIDNAGKSVGTVRVYTPNYGNTGFHFSVNGTDILNLSTLPQLQAIINSPRDVTISAAAGSITVTYAGYPPVTVPVEDPTANWQNPATLRITFKRVNGNSYGTHTIGVKDMSFYTPPTPDISFSGFGAIGDGATDNYNAFKSMAAYAADHPYTSVVAAPGTYYISQYHNGSNSITDINFTNVRGFKFHGNNDVTIKINGNYNRDFTHTDPDGVTRRSTISAIVPFQFYNCKNIALSGFAIDGGVAQTTRDSGVFEAGTYGVAIFYCDTVNLKDLYVHHTQTDGIYISSGFIGSYLPTKNVTLDNVRSFNCARQGMSIVGGEHIRINNCQFKYTGITDGGYARLSPSAGVDVETSDFAFINDVVFNRSAFEGNIGGQILITRPSKTDSVTVKNCTIGKTITGGFQSTQALTMFVKNGLVDSNTCDIGPRNIFLTSTSPTFDSSNVVFTNNYVKSSLSGISLPSTTNTSNSTLIQNNVFEFDGSSMSVAFPSLQTPNVSFLNNTININSTAISSRNPNSLIQNATSSIGNTYSSGVVRSYTGTITVSDP